MGNVKAKAHQLLAEAYHLMEEIEANGYRLTRSGSRLTLHDRDEVDVDINEMVGQHYGALLVVVAINECFTEVSAIVDEWCDQVSSD